ncbi:MAG: beta-propeller domain-containing protein [Longimicrobiaceae bacterium]
MRNALSALLLAALATSASAQPRPTPRALQPFRSGAELSAYLADFTPSARVVPQGPVVVGYPAPCVGGTTVTRVAAPSAGAPVVIRGRVTDPAGHPLSGAQVQVESPLVRTVTTANGEYRLLVPANGIAAQAELRVVATTLGRQADRRVVPAVPGDTFTVDFRLCASAVALEGITVNAVGATSVTNNQVAGVDEGDIVKVHGDHLVMLRRGRLFTVSLKAGRMEPVSAVNAFGDDVEPGGTWYDELLVAGDIVVVLGYSYSRGGTELGLFDIDRGGRLSYRATYHLRSNDYYSSRNYASRLIGTRLVMYTPLWVGGRLRDWAPALRRWHRGARNDEFRPIAAPTRIFRPGGDLEPGEELALHTVTTCELGRPRISCSATGVLGPYSENFYVSATAAYVWVSDWPGRARNRAPSMLYRLPLDGSSPSALGVRGSPVDQFSFHESGDGYLNVVTMTDAAGARMWAAERAQGAVSLLRVPLASFSDGRRSAHPESYRALPGPAAEDEVFQNRFVGRHLLYGTGSGWDFPDHSGRSVLYVTRWAGGPVAALTLPHGVDRIEPMGSDAVVVGTDGRDLHFTAIHLGGRARVAQRYVSRNAAQGELRSHGFFYREDGGDSGVLGLPVRGAGRPGYEHLFAESAGVIFLRNRHARFQELGVLSANPPKSGDDEADGCIASCVDWYGNSRPLFLRGRVFALLGYELVEGTVSNGRIREVARVSYAPPRVAVSRR